MSIRIYKNINRYVIQIIDITEQDFLFLMGFYETIEFKYEKYNNKDRIIFQNKINNVRYNVDNAKGVMDRFKVRK